jgi:hypothetical protein
MDTDPHRKGPLPDGPTPRNGGSTTAQLKTDIDSGKTGDKVSVGDPGLSPLGTDDEAGGHPNSPELIDQMRQLETKTQTGPRPGAHDQRQRPLPLNIMLWSAIAIALAVLWFVLTRGGGGT